MPEPAFLEFASILSRAEFGNPRKFIGKMVDDYLKKLKSPESAITEEDYERFFSPAERYADISFKVKRRLNTESNTPWSNRVHNWRTKGTGAENAAILAYYWFHIGIQDSLYAGLIDIELLGAPFEERFFRPVPRNEEDVLLIRKSLDLGWFKLSYDPAAELDDLLLPERRLPLNCEEGSFPYFQALSWKTRLTTLIGRDSNIAELESWAENAPSGVNIAALCGRGGGGKSRLAADVASILDGKLWNAGFLPPQTLNNAVVSAVASRSFIIIDYSDEYRQHLTELLRRVHYVQSKDRRGECCCILLLSRKSTGFWKDLFKLHSVETSPVFTLESHGLLCIEAATALIEQAATQTAALLGRETPSISNAAEWLRQSPAHRTPLITIAAGIHATVTGTPALNLSERELLEDLAMRELRRVRGVSTAEQLGELTLERLLALTTLTEAGIRADTINDLLEGSSLRETTPPDVMDRLQLSPWWAKPSDKNSDHLFGSLVRIEPDRLSAAFFSITILRTQFQWFANALTALLATEGKTFLQHANRLYFDLASISPQDASRWDQLLSQTIEASPALEEQFRNAPGEGFTLLRRVKDLHVRVRGNAPQQAGDTVNSLLEAAIKYKLDGDIRAALDRAMKAINIYYKWAGIAGHNGDIFFTIALVLCDVLKRDGNPDAALQIRAGALYALNYHDGMKVGAVRYLDLTSSFALDLANSEFLDIARSEAMLLHKEAVNKFVFDSDEIRLAAARAFYRVSLVFWKTGEQSLAEQYYKSSIEIVTDLLDSSPDQYVEDYISISIDFRLVMHRDVLTTNWSEINSQTVPIIQKAAGACERLYRSNIRRYGTIAADTFEQLGIALSSCLRQDEARQAFLRSLEISSEYAQETNSAPLVEYVRAHYQLGVLHNKLFTPDANLHHLNKVFEYGDLDQAKENQYIATLVVLTCMIRLNDLIAEGRSAERYSLIHKALDLIATHWDRMPKKNLDYCLEKILDRCLSEQDTLFLFQIHDKLKEIALLVKPKSEKSANLEACSLLFRKQYKSFRTMIEFFVPEEAGHARHIEEELRRVPGFSVRNLSSTTIREMFFIQFEPKDLFAMYDLVEKGNVKAIFHIESRAVEGLEVLALYFEKGDNRKLQYCFCFERSIHMWRFTNDLGQVLSLGGAAYSSGEWDAERFGFDFYFSNVKGYGLRPIELNGEFWFWPGAPSIYRNYTARRIVKSARLNEKERDLFQCHSCLHITGNGRILRVFVSHQIDGGLKYIYQRKLVTVCLSQHLRVKSGKHVVFSAVIPRIIRNIRDFIRSENSFVSSLWV